MAIVTNIAKIYLNLDKTLKKVINPFISRGANNTVQIMLVAPFNIQNSEYVNFELESTVEVPTRYMMLIAYENSVDTNNENWGVWVYTIGEKILAGAASNNSEELNISFTEFLNEVTPSSFEFIGFQSTEAALNTNFPTPDDDQYAGVGDGTTLGTSVCYLAVNGTWVNQNVTVLVFESNNDILRKSFIGESVIVTLGIDPNISTINDEVDNTNLDVVFKNLSTLNGKVLDIETLLGTDGENFVKSDLLAEYLATSTPEGDDQLYIQKANGDLRRTSFADLAAGARDNFIGTFDTASGLSCPDPDDLLCTYPNGIADPNDRLGWVANVDFTSTKWRWITASNEWQDTGESPSLAKDIGYDPASDPSTAETNVQDAMVEHGIKINTNKTDLDAQKLKTQKLNSDGDIALDIEVITTKDISSPDLDSGTSGTYTKLIQAIVAEYTRQNAQDTLIGNNATAIATKLIADFSTLLNKASPANTDLLVLRDGATNKNISWLELVSAIETTIVNDQGYFTTIAALKSSLPVGEAGWFATIGDEDYIAIWDVETADWVQSAQKLHYSQTAGTALELRMTTAEGQIVSINASLALKFDKANLTNDVVGNSTNEFKATTPKGVFDYVNRIDLLNEADRKYSTMIQAPVTADFYISSLDTDLVNGRIEYLWIETVSPNDFDARFSVDGGVTFKNLAIANGFNLNPAQNVVFGNFFEFVYSSVFDKWLIFRTDQDFIELSGLDIGWTPDKNIQQNWLDGQVRDTRISALEGGSLSGKSFIVEEVTPLVPIVASETQDLLVKITFNNESIESNDRNIINIDGNGDIVLIEDAEPGYRATGNFEIKNTGTVTPDSLSSISFYLFHLGAVIAIGNELDIITISAANIDEPDTQADRSKSKILSDEFINANLGGFPVTLQVYYANNGTNPTDIIQASLTAESLFTGVGISSTDNVTLSTPAEETRGGVLPSQSDHNKESVIDRKNLLESQTVIVANYQSAGQYLANKPNINLETNKIVRVLFSGSGSDLTELVELSLDNGSNYYDVEYRLTDVDLTVKNAVTHVMDLYFTGAKFIATYVDSPIENQDLPYVKLSGRFDIPKNEVPVHIGEEIAGLIKDYKGGTLNQLNLFGDKVSSIIHGTYMSQDAIGDLVANAAYNASHLTYQVVSGNRYFLRVKMANTSINVLRNELLIRYSDDDFSISSDIVLSVDELSAYGTITANKSLLVNLLARAGAAGTQLDNLSWEFIQVTDTFLEGLTADEINNRITFFKGQQSVGSPVIYAEADYSDELNAFIQALGYEVGDDIQGVFVESFGNNKFNKLKVEPNTTISGAGDVGVSAQDDFIIPMADFIIGETYIVSGDDVGDFPVFGLYNSTTIFNASTLIRRQAGSREITIDEGTLTVYAKFSGLFGGNVPDADIQIQLGTVATEYEEFIKAIAYINEELGDVPSAEDDFDFVRTKSYVLTEDDITGITIGSFVDWVTVLTSVFDGIKTQETGVIDGSFRIVDFPTEIASGLDTAGNEYHFNTTTTGGGSLFLAFESGKYASLAAAKTALAGTKIRYELATPLPRDGILAPLLDMTGNIITGPGYTYSQKSSSGITNEFKATTAVNTKAQIQLNVEAIINIFKMLTGNSANIDKLIEQVLALIDGQGYIPDLDTAATNLVDAVNEVLADLLIAEGAIVDNANAILANAGNYLKSFRPVYNNSLSQAGTISYTWTTTIDEEEFKLDYLIIYLVSSENDVFIQEGYLVVPFADITTSFLQLTLPSSWVIKRTSLTGAIEITIEAFADNDPIGNTSVFNMRFFGIDMTQI